MLQYALISPLTGASDHRFTRKFAASFTARLSLPQTRTAFLSSPPHLRLDRTTIVTTEAAGRPRTTIAPLVLTDSAGKTAAASTSTLHSTRKTRTRWKLSRTSPGTETSTKTFQFAGTKDRRAVTAQRVSAYRVEAERVAGLNRSLKYAAVGDFEYHAKGLELGDLSGNEFVVTLRGCQLEGPLAEQSIVDPKEQLQSYLSRSLRQLYEKGFLNYYGLQRLRYLCNPYRRGRSKNPQRRLQRCM